VLVRQDAPSQQTIRIQRVASWGGLEVGNAYLDKFDLRATVRGANNLSSDALSLHLDVQYGNGHAFSGSEVGDSQVVSNVEGVNTWRMLALWGDYRFGTED
jgi:hypothetical protein